LHSCIFQGAVSSSLKTRGLSGLTSRANEKSLLPLRETLKSTSASNWSDTST
jgi:hypothetical protein